MALLFSIIPPDSPLSHLKAAFPFKRVARSSGWRINLSAGKQESNAIDQHFSSAFLLPEQLKVRSCKRQPGPLFVALCPEQNRVRVIAPPRDGASRHRSLPVRPLLAWLILLAATPRGHSGRFTLGESARPTERRAVPAPSRSRSFAAADSRSWRAGWPGARAIDERWPSQPPAGSGRHVRLFRRGALGRELTPAWIALSLVPHG